MSIRDDVYVAGNDEFDISNHEWADEDLSFNCVDSDGYIMLDCDYIDGVYLSREDTIAMAKHFKLTIEDLK